MNEGNKVSSDEEEGRQDGGREKNHGIRYKKKMEYMD